MAFSITSGKVHRAQKVVVYGPEGIGKTTFAAKFPNPLFIDTEGGSGHLDVNRLDTPSSWRMLLEEVAWVASSPSVCSTLVLDTADWAESMCLAHVVAKAENPKVKGIEDFGYGKGYVYAQEEFGRLLNALSDVAEKGVNVVVTAHAQMRKFEQPDEAAAYDRWELKLSKKIAPLLKEWADAVLFANYKTIVETVDAGMGQKKGKARGGRRVLNTSHHACWDAKNRWGLPDEVDFDYPAIAEHIPARAAQRRQAPAPAASPAPAPAASAQSAASPTPKTAPRSIVFDKDGRVVSDTAATKAEEVLPPHLRQLRDLMAKDGINDAQIRDAVASKRYYTIETPIENYSVDFVTAALVADWPKVVQLVESRKPYTDPLPFE